MQTSNQKSQKNLLGIFLTGLLMIYTLLFMGCSKDPASPDDDGNKNTPRTAVPVYLTGDWQTGTISSIDFFNPVTGVFGPPSGVGMFFKFTQDGYYEKGVLLQSTLYGHTMTFFAYNKGTMTIEDSVIVLYPTYGRIKSEDNMVPENNYEKPDELDSETMLWENGTDDLGLETLWLRYPDSGYSAFHRP